MSVHEMSGTRHSAGFAGRTVHEHATAVARLLKAVQRQAEVVALDELARQPHRTVAEELRSPIALPPFDNSQMDGFAVRAADIAHATPQSPVRLPVTGHIAAGKAGGELPPRQAWAVMTGAPIPAGCDVVVPIEASGLDVFPAEDEVGAEIVVQHPSDVGTYIRPAGSDLKVEEVIAAAGAPLTPAMIGALAFAGITNIPVVRRLRVLVLATGSELTPPGIPLGLGGIYDANTPALTALLSAAGASVVTETFVDDDPEALNQVMIRHAGTIDLLVTAGGVSKGAHEVVREALEPLGVTFGTVLMQPGGPQGLGCARIGNIDLPVVALPGNPVSALVSAEMFLRPALLQLSGWSPERARLSGPLARRVDSPVGKHQVRRARIDESGAIEMVGGPSSHLLHSFARSELLVQFPVGVGTLQEGEFVEAWRIND